MSIEHIKNHIIGNAQKEAEQIVRTADEQFRTQVNAAKASLEKQSQEFLQKEEKRIKEDMERSLSTLKRDYKMKLLEIKNNIIDDVLARAVNRIQSLPDDEYLALVRKWLANIPDYLDGQLFVNTRDLKRITSDFIDAINKNRKTRLILNNTTLEIKGGFIVKTEHYEIDYSLDTLVKSLRTTLVPELDEFLQLSCTEL